MNVTLRQATADDAPLLSAIHAASWKHFYRGIVPQDYLDALPENHWNAAFSQWLGEGILDALLLLLDGQPMGCVAFGPAREPQKASWGEIVSLYLRPEAARKGHGTRLMTAALERLRAQKLTPITLWVLRDNLAARAFYERIGFANSAEELECPVGGAVLVDLRYNMQ